MSAFLLWPLAVLQLGPRTLHHLARRARKAHG